MRCPDCNKFTSQEMSDVEIEEVELDGTTINVQARIALQCAECGTEMKEANFDNQVDVAALIPELHKDHELGVEHGDPEQLDELEGRGRIKKHFYGYRLYVTVGCTTCGEQPAIVQDVEVTDKIQSSHMDEMV